MTTSLILSRRAFILASAAALASSRVHGQATPEATPAVPDDLSWSSIVDDLPEMARITFTHLTFAPGAAMTSDEVQDHTAILVLDGELSATLDEPAVIHAGEGSFTAPGTMLALQNASDITVQTLLLQIHPIDDATAIGTPAPAPQLPGVEVRTIASYFTEPGSRRCILLIEQDVRRRNAPFVTSTTWQGLEMGEIQSGSASVVFMYGTHYVAKADDPDNWMSVEHAERLTLTDGDRYVSYGGSHNWRVGSDERLVTWRAQVIPIPQPA